MRNLADDDLLLDLIESVTLDVLDRIRDDPAARYAFFKRFLVLAQDAVEVRGSQVGHGVDH